MLMTTVMAATMTTMTTAMTTEMQRRCCHSYRHPIAMATTTVALVAAMTTMIVHTTVLENKHIYGP
jgi:hypothetical protein